MDFNKFLNESKITVKRRYTENYPARTVGKSAKVRNKVLEAIADGKITQEEFNKIVSELSNNSKKWTRKNSRYFSVSEEGVSLSNLGKRVLKSITVNEKTEKNPGIWVPSAFDKAISKLPNSKITREEVLKIADKYDIDPGDAIPYVEFGWDLDLSENSKNNKKQMKNNKLIHESFQDFVDENLVNEAFKSSKLSAIMKLDLAQKNIMKAVYNFAKVKLDEITDDQIVELHPAEAYKTKAHPNAIFFYISDNEKKNPYADYSQARYNGYGTIPGNTLLAIANGKNEMFAMDYTRGWNRSAPYEPKMQNVGRYGKEASSIGIDKQHAGYGASGLSNIKRISEVSDRVLMFDPSILPSTVDQRNQRSDAKAGAISFMNDKEFKQENLNRYKMILATRAANDDIDGMVEKAIETVTGHIQSALKNKTAGKYDSMIIGTDKKGREISMRDAANVISNILDMYQTYVRYTNDAKDPESSKYYAREAATYAKSIKDKVKKVNTMDYAW